LYGQIFLSFSFVPGESSPRPLLPAVIVLSVFLSFAIVGISFLIWRQWQNLDAKKADTGTKTRQDNELVKEAQVSGDARNSKETLYFELCSVRTAQERGHTADNQYQELLRFNKSPIYDNVTE